LEIRAPFAGVVSQRGYDVGALVTPHHDKAGTPIFIVAEYHRVRVLVEVPETDAHLIENGRRVNVRIPALGNRLFEGTVSRSAWGLTEGTRTLRCEVDLPNDDGKLRHRMFAKMELLIAERPNALTIPRTAVIVIDGIPHCLVVRNGEIERVPLKVGVGNPTDVEVLEGLTGSEQVVSSNVMAFQPGQKVRTQ
jgi:HlyD family secretion protein